jgi:hypothetical protein
VAKFAELDLTPRTVPNEAMGYIFEDSCVGSPK